MIAQDDKTHAAYRCAVELSQSEVDAGADLKLKVQVSCPDGDAAGLSVSIRNHDDLELASAGLSEAEEGEDEDEYDYDYITGDIVLKAPVAAGEHVYRAVLLSRQEDGVLREKASAQFSFTVTAHGARMNVWDVPSAIVAGETFRMKVGIKCTAGCNLAHRELSIVDHQGVRLGGARLEADVWPETTALYFSEVEATAPLKPGSFQWAVETPGSTINGLPHAAGTLAFSVRTVSPPECEVTVEAVDKEKQTPIKGAQVVMHPYRAVTDEKGMARIKLAKGPYTILVSGKAYIPISTEVDVVGNFSTKAELTVEPPSNPYE